VLAAICETFRSFLSREKRSLRLDVDRQRRLGRDRNRDRIDLNKIEKRIEI